MAGFDINIFRVFKTNNKHNNLQIEEISAVKGTLSLTRTSHNLLPLDQPIKKTLL